MAVTVASDGGNLAIAQLAGVHRRWPRLAMALLVGVLSLGVSRQRSDSPERFLAFNPTMERGYFLLVIIAMVNMIVSLYYYVQVVKASP